MIVPYNVQNHINVISAAPKNKFGKQKNVDETYLFIYIRHSTSRSSILYPVKLKGL